MLSLQSLVDYAIKHDVNSDDMMILVNPAYLTEWRLQYGDYMLKQLGVKIVQSLDIESYLIVHK